MLKICLIGLNLNSYDMKTKYPDKKSYYNLLNYRHFFDRRTIDDIISNNDSLDMFTKLLNIFSKKDGHVNIFNLEDLDYRVVAIYCLALSRNINKLDFSSDEIIASGFDVKKTIDIIGQIYLNFRELIDKLKRLTEKMSKKYDLKCSADFAFYTNIYVCLASILENHKYTSIMKDKDIINITYLKNLVNVIGLIDVDKVNWSKLNEYINKFLEDLHSEKLIVIDEKINYYDVTKKVKNAYI